MKKSAIRVSILLLPLLGGCLSETSTSVGLTSGPSGNPNNSAPSIGGSPQNVAIVGQQYSFTPTAQDADNDTLTFSIENAPSWANFDPDTGELSGQLSLGDIGVYDAIRISVTDGTVTTTLNAFSITVSQGGSGSITLTWTPPTQNTDGTMISDLAGYYIYYGVTPNVYPNRIRVDNATISTYVIGNLTPDTYNVTVTSFNDLGIESGLSNIVVRSVN